MIHCLGEAGNIHDCKVAQLCIKAMPLSAKLFADKGYDSQALREWLQGHGTEPVIPPRKNRKIQYDYDRNIKNFMGAVILAAAVIWGL